MKQIFGIILIGVGIMLAVGSGPFAPIISYFVVWPGIKMLFNED